MSDGALSFDTLGRFGYGLVAATGRSGAATPSGGTVYTIGASGEVKAVGGYKGPGGADEGCRYAPAGFGVLAGDALLTVDAGTGGGRVVVMDPSGRTRTLASFLRDGPNPIVEIPTSENAGGTPAPRIYAATI